MLDFRSRRRRTPNFTGAREQRHLLFLVLSVGVVLIALAEAGAGGAWGWFQRLSGKEDNDIPATLAAGQATVANKTLPGLDLKLLRAVRDDRPLNGGDQVALEHLFDTLDQTSDESLAAASTGPLIYRQVYHQPTLYRGETMKVVGVARRAVRPVANPQNSQSGANPQNSQSGAQPQSNVAKADPGDASAAAEGIVAFADETVAEGTPYWQLWVFPHGGDDPLIVNCRELPEGFPEGIEIAERVEMQAVFFKRLWYTTKDRIMSAPMLVAKAIGWKRPEPKPLPEVRRLSVRDFVYSTLGTILIGLAVVLYVVWRTEKLRKSRKAALNSDGPMSFRERLATQLHMRALEANPPSPVPAPGDVVLDEDDAPAQGSS